MWGLLFIQMNKLKKIGDKCTIYSALVKPPKSKAYKLIQIYIYDVYMILHFFALLLKNAFLVFNWIIKL